MAHGSEGEGTWFTEASLPFAEEDIRLQVRTTGTLCDRRSEYARIQVFDTPFFGRVLVIDGIINIARETEFIYHEMMVALPSIYHGEPKSVLIIGGGDGGAAKCALGINSVERIVQVEIDKVVIDVCSEFLPELAEGALSDSRVELIIGDGIRYVRETSEKFDLVVIDIDDPVPGGPSEHSLEEAFFRDVAACLRPGGVAATHCGALLFQAKKAELMVRRFKSVFSSVTMHVALVPEFELTEFGFLACSNGPPPSSLEVEERFSRLMKKECRHLCPEVFASSRVLSPYLQELTGVRNG